MLGEVNGFLAARSQVQLTLVSLLLLSAIASLDYLTGYELSFSLFYLIPVSISAWHSGKHLGIAVSIVCAATWLAIDYSSGQRYSQLGIPFWNACVRLGFFIIVARLLWHLRTALEYQSSLAEHDGLTGMLNNRSFKQRCASLASLATRSGRPMVLGYLDLDDFKVVNDSLGHGGGDDVLKAVANMLGERLRKSDIVGRMGGDEFAILLPETDLASARTIFSELHERLMDLATQNRWPVGFSIGVAAFHYPPADPEDAMKYADDLMYKVKGSGKNSIRFEEYCAEPHCA